MSILLDTLSKKSTDKNEIRQTLYFYWNIVMTFVCLFLPERLSIDGKAKAMIQRDRDELQHKFDRFKADVEMKHNRTLEETTRKYKIESEEMMKRAIQDNIRRIQADTERILAASKKKSWCSNCIKEVRSFFYTFTNNTTVPKKATKNERV